MRLRRPERVPRRALVAVAVVLVVAAAAVAVFVFDVGRSDDPQSARRKQAAVTEADNGREVEVPASKPFIVDLKGSEDAPWSLPEGTPDVLARVSSSQDLDGSAAATFMPLDDVPAIITADRVPACRAAETPCDTPAERFQVTVRAVR
ncbi:MAG: hypothetical protein QOI56_913 [Actinomycetota bacterium]|nr:hypothetical protein [Actinomycetota bacterium]